MGLGKGYLTSANNLNKRRFFFHSCYTISSLLWAWGFILRLVVFYLVVRSWVVMSAKFLTKLFRVIWLDTFTFKSNQNTYLSYFIFILGMYFSELVIFLSVKRHYLQMTIYFPRPFIFFLQTLFHHCMFCERFLKRKRYFLNWGFGISSANFWYVNLKRLNASTSRKHRDSSQWPFYCL